RLLCLSNISLRGLYLARRSHPAHLLVSLSGPVPVRPGVTRRLGLIRADACSGIESPGGPAREDAARGIRVVDNERQRPRPLGHVRPAKRRQDILTSDCDRLPETFHGKEGVDASSPSEGSAKAPHVRAFLGMCSAGASASAGPDG